MPATEVSSPRQPTLARSSTARTSDRQLSCPGSRPVTLTRRWLSPKVRQQVAVADAHPVLGREVEVGGEGGQILRQAVNRARIRLAPLLGEEVGALVSDAGSRLARRPLDAVEDGPVVLLDRLLVELTDLGEHVAGSAEAALVAERGPASLRSSRGRRRSGG